MRPIVEEILKEFPNIILQEYDYDLDYDDILKYNVGNILPVLILEDNEKEIVRIIGEKTKDELMNILRSNI